MTTPVTKKKYTQEEKQEAFMKMREGNLSWDEMLDICTSDHPGILESYEDRLYDLQGEAIDRLVEHVGIRDPDMEDESEG